jgi:SpoU rRNA methylase family enzyme
MISAAAFFIEKIWLRLLIIFPFNEPDITQREADCKSKIIFTQQHGTVTTLTKFKRCIYNIALVDLLVSKAFNGPAPNRGVPVVSVCFFGRSSQK